MVLDHDPIATKVYTGFFDEMEAYVLQVTCASPKEAIFHESRYPVDLLITETNINGQSGLRFVNRTLEQNPKTKVLVISADNNFEIIKQAFKIGVHGFLTKPITPERLQAALHTIAEEGTALSNDVSKKIISIFRQKSYPMLSQRENEIIGYIGEGATYKDIAKKLFVTPSTVNFHLQNIYLKLNVKSKSEALHRLKTFGAPVY